MTNSYGTGGGFLSVNLIYMLSQGYTPVGFKRTRPKDLFYL